VVISAAPRRSSLTALRPRLCKIDNSLDSRQWRITSTSSFINQYGRAIPRTTTQTPFRRPARDEWYAHISVAKVIPYMNSQLLLPGSVLIFQPSESSSRSAGDGEFFWAISPDMARFSNLPRTARRLKYAFSWTTLVFTSNPTSIPLLAEPLDIGPPFLAHTKPR